MTFTTRFAPSPTGPLHLGHAYSAIIAHDLAQKNGGRFLLRIEDIDHTRARSHWEDQIYKDLAWLGLRWEKPVLRQSDRLVAYRETLEKIWADGHAFACFCNRRDIQAALSAPQEGAEIPHGPDGPIYPGTCRENRAPQIGTFPDNAAMRLAMSDVALKVAAGSTDGFHFIEQGSDKTKEIHFTAQDAIAELGDIVLARRDIGTSYHLSVVLDDHLQGITHVVRGQDLFEATKIHVVLQRMLGLLTPTYHHHQLIRDDQGKRLAKRDDARAIAKYRDEGASPLDIRRMVGLA